MFRLFSKKITLRIYMKSGNVIVADRVVDKVKITTRGDEVTGIERWEQVRPKNKLMLSTLALGQIEAITIHK